MATDKQSAEKEITVEEKLSTLYQLQTMMTEIDKIKTLRGELPLEVQDLEDEIAGLETRLQNYQSEIKDFENAVVEQKHKITESTGLIEKYKAQLDNVRNNREFDIRFQFLCFFAQFLFVLLGFGNDLLQFALLLNQISLTAFQSFGQFGDLFLLTVDRFTEFTNLLFRELDFKSLEFYFF